MGKRRDADVAQYTTLALMLGADFASARCVAREIVVVKSLRGRVARLRHAARRFLSMSQVT